LLAKRFGDDDARCEMEAAFPVLNLWMFPSVTNAIFFAIVIWRELSCFDPFIFFANERDRTHSYA